MGIAEAVGLGREYVDVGIVYGDREAVELLPSGPMTRPPTGVSVSPAQA